VREGVVINVTLRRWKTATLFVDQAQFTIKMRTSFSILLLWGVGQLASVVLTKACSYRDKPRIITHAGERAEPERLYDGGERMSHNREGPLTLSRMSRSESVHLSSQGVKRPNTVGV
jgi:hypothetical protein